MATKKTLVENWVEERQCKDVDADNLNPDGTLCTKLHREGHKGLVSLNALSSPMETCSTTNTSFTVPEPCPVQIVGKKNQLLKQQLYELASSQVDDVINPAPPKMDYTTTTKGDYTSEYMPSNAKENTVRHDLSEEPVSYWTGNVHHITGISQVCQTTSPFKRNTAFSTPIEYYLDQPKPHEH